MPACRPGIEPHALAQFGNRLLSRAAVPQGRAEVVPCLGRFRTKDRGPLQVWKRGRQVALLAEHVSLQRVRFRMIGVLPEDVGERISRRLEITPRDRRLRAPDSFVCRARWRRSGLPRGGALLLQSGAEREVTLAQLGIDLERAFELLRRLAELAALPQRLSELVVHGRIAGIGFDDATQVLQSGLEVTLFAQCHAQVEVRGHALGLEREGLPEHLHGLVELAALCERRPPSQLCASANRAPPFTRMLQPVRARVHSLRGRDRPAPSATLTFGSSGFFASACSICGTGSAAGLVCVTGARAGPEES